jgi:hypothetical protein
MNAKVCDLAAEMGLDSDDPRVIAESNRREHIRIKEFVARKYWLVTAVNGWPRLNYTVGLWSQGLPELVLFGQPGRIAQPLLNEVGALVVAGDFDPYGDEDVEIAGWQLRPVPLRNPGAVILTANRFYGRKPRNSVPAVQLFYPDVHGVFPWEDECHQFPGEQPLPGEPFEQLSWPGTA